MIPPALLQGIFFNPDKPLYFNFASLGSSVAARLIKDLRFFTSNDENVINIPFDASSKCFEDDLFNILGNDHVMFKKTLFLVNYNYYFQDYNITLTVNDIVSDIIGVDIAYKAYQNFDDQSSKDKFDFDYTPNQLFWIKANMLNCYKNVITSNKFENLEIVSRLKTILSVRHSRHFAKDFNCRLETAMNPEKKC